MTVVLLIVIAVIALGFTVQPLLMGSEEPMAIDAESPRRRLLSRRKVIYDSIRDLDFELAMGKLTTEDHGPLRQGLLAEAAAVLRDIDNCTDEELDTWIEQAVAVAGSAAHPVCPSCQRQVPPGARFCDGCGTSLAAPCAGCGARMQGDARFCQACGVAR